MRIASSDDLQPPISCAECEVGRFTMYAPTVAISPEAMCLRRREVRTIPPGRTIVRDGEPQQTVFILYSGWAFSYNQLPDGRRQILSFLLPGDTLVLESLFSPALPLPFSVKSLTQISVCGFSVGDLIEVAQSSDEQRAEVSRNMQSYLREVHRRLTDIGRRSALGRIAHLLLELEGRLERRGMVDDGRFEFPVRQEHLADALGLTTVYVNRTLVALRNRRLIAFDRQSMTILEFDELRRIAQEE